MCLCHTDTKPFCLPSSRWTQHDHLSTIQDGSHSHALSGRAAGLHPVLVLVPPLTLPVTCLHTNGYNRPQQRPHGTEVSFSNMQWHSLIQIDLYFIICCLYSIWLINLAADFVFNVAFGAEDVSAAAGLHNKTPCLAKFGPVPLAQRCQGISVTYCSPKLALDGLYLFFATWIRSTWHQGHWCTFMNCVFSA